MDKKINQIIDFNTLSIGILKDDVKALNRLGEFGYVVPNYFLDTLTQLEDTKDIDQAVITFGTLFDKLAQDEQFDLALIIQQFLQRHGYLAATLNDYQNYAGHIDAKIMEGNTVADIFTAVYVPFFSKQIEYYSANFLDTLNNYPVIEWNVDFYNNLKKEVEFMISEPEFLIKLEAAEKFIAEFANPEKLYNDLKIEFGTPDAEKEAFTTQFNEYKITLQSIDLLIERTINKIKGVLGQ